MASGDFPTEATHPYTHDIVFDGEDVPGLITKAGFRNLLESTYRGLAASKRPSYTRNRSWLDAIVNRSQEPPTGYKGGHAAWKNELGCTNPRTAKWKVLDGSVYKKVDDPLTIGPQTPTEGMYELMTRLHLEHGHQGRDNFYKFVKPVSGSIKKAFCLQFAQVCCEKASHWQSGGNVPAGWTPPVAASKAAKHTVDNMADVDNEIDDEEFQAMPPAPLQFVAANNNLGAALYGFEIEPQMDNSLENAMAMGNGMQFGQNGQFRYPDGRYSVPQYCEPQYGAPQYGALQYGSLQYGGPQCGGPQYGGPQYGSPQYGGPQYGVPQNGGHQYGAPLHNAAQCGIPQYAVQAPQPAVASPRFVTGPPSLENHQFAVNPQFAVDPPHFGMGLNISPQMPLPPFYQSEPCPSGQIQNYSAINYGGSGVNGSQVDGLGVDSRPVADGFDFNDIGTGDFDLSGFDFGALEADDNNVADDLDQYFQPVPT